MYFLGAIHCSVCGSAETPVMDAGSSKSLDIPLVTLSGEAGGRDHSGICNYSTFGKPWLMRAYDCCVVQWLKPWNGLSATRNVLAC